MINMSDIKTYEKYCPPTIKLITIEQSSIICQSGPIGTPTDTDPIEDRF